MTGAVGVVLKCFRVFLLTSNISGKYRFYDPKAIVGTFHGNLPQVTKIDIEATTKDFGNLWEVPMEGSYIILSKILKKRIPTS
jgi:hypothetical protein